MIKVTLISENLKLSQEISLVIKIFNVHHNKKNIILYLSKEGRSEIKNKIFTLGGGGTHL